MPTRASEPGVGGAAKRVADHARALAGLEVELAKVELKKKVAAIGVSTVLLVVAALFGLFALGYGLAAAAAGFATFLPWWASLLIVFGICLGLAGILAGVGAAGLKRGAPPVPEQALEEARRTTEALRNGR